MDDIPSYQISRDGEVIGTFTVLEVEKRRRSKIANDLIGDLVPSGLVNKLNDRAFLPTDQFWREGMSEWRPMTDFEPEILAYKEAEKRRMEAERKQREAEELARMKAEQERAAQAAIEAENARKQEEINRALAEQKAKEAEEAAARKAIADAEAAAAEIRMRQERLAKERARAEREKAEQARAEAARRREQALGEQWYFLEGDKRMGPVSGSRILELQAETRLSVDTLICPKAGAQAWTPLYATALGDGNVPPPPSAVKGHETLPRRAYAAPTPVEGARPNAGSPERAMFSDVPDWAEAAGAAVRSEDYTFQHAQSFCGNCRQVTDFSRKKSTAGGGDLLLVIFTCGVWLLFRWFMMGEPWRCERCGRLAGSGWTPGASRRLTAPLD